MCISDIAHETENCLLPSLRYSTLVNPIIITLQMNSHSLSVLLNP